MLYLYRQLSNLTLLPKSTFPFLRISEILAVSISMQPCRIMHTAIGSVCVGNSYQLIFWSSSVEVLVFGTSVGKVAVSGSDVLVNMADGSGQNDIRGLHIQTLVTGFAEDENMFKGVEGNGYLFEYYY